MFSDLQAAEEGGYAIGAFNVYNLEGAMAVVAAAEEEKSPAILQVLDSHTSILSLELIRIINDALWKISSMIVLSVLGHIILHIILMDKFACYLCYCNCSNIIIIILGPK